MVALKKLMNMEMKKGNHLQVICLHLYLFTFLFSNLFTFSSHIDADGEEEVIVSPKLSVPIDQESRKDSLFDQNVGPPLDPTQLRNYKTIEQILLRMNRLCVHNATGKERPHEQLLLRNMGVHTVVLDLLQIPYDHKEDVLMNEIMKLAHEFLQNFCLKNTANQSLLHKHIDLFLTPGVSLLLPKVHKSIFKN